LYPSILAGIDATILMSCPPFPKFLSIIVSPSIQSSLLNGVIEKYSFDLSNKIDTLADYHRNNFKNIDDEFRNGIVEHAKEVNAFDPEIYVIYKQVEEICRKFPFLNALMEDMRGYDTSRTNILKQALVDLFKYHKHRIDWKNYNIRLNEDLPLEQELKEETVEELI
jgi:hypothetical protein